MNRLLRSFRPRQSKSTVRTTADVQRALAQWAASQEANRNGSRKPEHWELRDESGLVATLTVDGDDFPWLHARLEPTPRFVRYRALFDEELEAISDPAIEEDQDAAARFERAYNRIRAAVTLHLPDGRAVPEFMLHIEGDRAWWRWHHEPFDTEPAAPIA